MYLPSYVLDTECDLLGVFISEHKSHAIMHVRKTDQSSVKLTMTSFLVSSAVSVLSGRAVTHGSSERAEPLDTTAVWSSLFRQRQSSALLFHPSL